MLTRLASITARLPALLILLGSGAAGHAVPAFHRCPESGQGLVGPPYFNSVFVPLMAPALFLMAAVPLARLKHSDIKGMPWRLWIAGALAVIRRGRDYHGDGRLDLPDRPGRAAGAPGSGRIRGWCDAGRRLPGGKDVRMAPGDTVVVGRHEFKFQVGTR